MTCPICNQGQLTEHIDRTGSIELVYSTCSHCGSEQASAEQAKRNKQAMLDYLEREGVT